MPNEAARPWKMLLPLAGVLILAAAWSAYWFVAIGIARETFAAERERLAGEGLSLNCTAEDWGGYPFRFEFHCASPVLKMRNEAEARAASLLAVALAYNPWQVMLLTDGPMTMTARGMPQVSASHERIVASLTIGRDSAPRFSADIPKLELPGLMTAERILIHTRPEAEAATGLALSVSKLNYQPPGRPPLIVDEGSLTATLTSQQTLKVARIDLAQGKVRYWGSGDVGLDGSHRLAGKLATETNDLDGLLAILEPHFELSEQEKAGLRTMLGLLGNEAKADIIASDGQLFLGPFRIADLAPLY